MIESVNTRKLEHLSTIAREAGMDRNGHYFDRVRLRHRALPEVDLSKVNPSVTFLGKRLNMPFLISSMTGGDHTLIRRINRRLARAAARCRVAMGVGSQRVMFTHPASRDSFALREVAPKIVLLANLGAVQLNHGFGVAECREAVEAIGADGLILHLNPLQEAVQPGGNTNFEGLADRIGEVVRELKCPVIVKEVGAGISREDADLLVERGVRYLDVAGSGGTSWSRIEAARAGECEEDDLGVRFQDWGLTTPEALADLAPLRDRVTLIASGGIRNGLDMVKAMVLGASLAASARPLLDAAIESEARVVALLERWQREIVTAMFLLGQADTAGLIGNRALLAPSVSTEFPRT